MAAAVVHEGNGDDASVAAVEGAPAERLLRAHSGPSMNAEEMTAYCRVADLRDPARRGLEAGSQMVRNSASWFGPLPKWVGRVRGQVALQLAAELLVL